MTDEQYKRYLEETLSEEEYRQVLEEGVVGDIAKGAWNGVKKVGGMIKNGIQSLAAGNGNISQNQATKITNQIADANTKNGKNLDAKSALEAGLGILAQDIAKQVKSLGKMQGKVDKKNALAQQKDAKAAQKNFKNNFGKDQEQPQNEEMTEAQNISEFFRFLEEQASIDQLLKQYGLDSSTNPQEILQVLQNLAEKQPDKVDAFVKNFYSVVPNAKHQMQVSKSIANFKKAKEAENTQQQMLNGDSQNQEKTPEETSAEKTETTEKAPAETSTETPPGASGEKSEVTSESEPAASNQGTDSEKTDGTSTDTNNVLAGRPDSFVKKAYSMVGYFEGEGGWQTKDRDTNLIAIAKAMDAAGIKESKLVSQFLYKYYN